MEKQSFYGCSTVGLGKILIPHGWLWPDCQYSLTKKPLYSQSTIKSTVLFHVCQSIHINAQ